MEKNQLLTALERAEHELLRLSRRHHFLLAYETAVERDLGPKKTAIPVRNEIILHLINDMFDMLVNDLVSFCKGSTEKGGFINLMGKEAHQFRVKSPEEITVPEAHIVFSRDITKEEVATLKEDFRQESIQETIVRQKEILATLFPEAHVGDSCVVTHRHVNQLGIRFKNIDKQLTKYRNEVSAHRYDQNHRKIGQKPPPMKEITKAIEAIQEIMNMIRVLIDDSSMAYSNMFGSSVENTANDLLDLAVCGSSWRVREEFNLNSTTPWWGSRDIFYKKLRDENEK